MGKNRIGVDAKAYYKTGVTGSVVRDEIYDARRNDCFTLYIYAPWFRNSAYTAADAEDEIDVHLIEWEP